MAMDRDNIPNRTTTGIDPMVDPLATDRATMNRPMVDRADVDGTTGAYDRDSRGSNFLAYLIGGLVIAVGLLAFLFYDGRSGTDPATTGTTSSAPSVTAPVSPNATGSSTTPASPAPASPAPVPAPAR